jgi:hypothetical protein
MTYRSFEPCIFFGEKTNFLKNLLKNPQFFNKVLNTGENLDG